MHPETILMAEFMFAHHRVIMEGAVDGSGFFVKNWLGTYDLPEAVEEVKPTYEKFHKEAFTANGDFFRLVHGIAASRCAQDAINYLREQRHVEFKIPLTDTDLAEISIGTLERSGITRIDQLLAKTANDLRSTAVNPKIMDRVIGDVEEMLAMRGLTLATGE